MILRQRREITDLSTSLEESRETIGLLQEKVEEKKKYMEEANDCIKLKDSQITYLKQQISLSTEKDIGTTDARKLQLLLKHKEKELTEIKQQSDLVVQKLLEENRKLRSECEKSSRLACESMARGPSFDSHRKLRSEDKVSSKENKQCLKFVGQPKRDVAFLEAEQYSLHKHRNPPHFEHELQMRDGRRGEVEEMSERLQKEMIIAEELSKLPEVAALYRKEAKQLDPIEQIAQSIDYLVEAIRVRFGRKM